MLKKKAFILFSVIFFILSICVIGVIAVIERDRSRTVSRLNITNLTGTGFTVSWVTEEKEKGKVVVVKKGESFGILPGIFKERFYDDRDIEQNDNGEWVLKEKGSQKRYTHHVTIRGLEPETEYEFRIMGRLIGMRFENGVSNEVKTQKISEDLTTPDPAYGKVLDTKLEGKSDIIIYANLFEYNENKDGEINISNTISTYTNSNGGYVFDLGAFYDIKGDRYKITDKTILKIITMNNKNGYINKFKIKNYKPLPSIIFEGRKNEIISNAIKHSKNPDSPLKIRLDLYLDGEHLMLKIQDNGAGLPKDFDPKKSKSYGMKLVSSIGKQLDADIRFENKNGLLITVSMVFPLIRR